jgi:DNA-binding transcriptional ArsR family regulator
MKPAVDIVLKLSREIIALEAQERAIRAKRDAKKEELTRVLNGEAPLEAPKSDFRAGSAVSRIIEILIAEYPKALTAEDLTRHTGIEMNAVRTSLSRLKNAHQITSPSRGEYRAVKHEEEGGTEPSA